MTNSKDPEPTINHQCSPSPEAAPAVPQPALAPNARLATLERKTLNPQHSTLNPAAATLQALLEPQTLNHPSSIALATEDQLATLNFAGVQPALLGSQPSTIDHQLSSDSQLATLNPGSLASTGKPRNGKIAHLPKLERDLVNRMLANNLPHHQIVSALDECGFQVTRRNISNWKTHGGYKEWRAAQEHALELRTFQDNLTGFLRRHDASELPEVGLQSAATSLSALLLRPDLIRELVSDPAKYSKLIEMQCRLAREIQALQKNRDDISNALGRRYNPETLKRQNEQEVEEIREIYSSKLGKSARDPNVPHRNFIPQELEPTPPVPAAPDPSVTTEFQKLLAATLRRSSPANPPPDKVIGPVAQCSGVRNGFGVRDAAKQC